jgi:protein-tyrosine phosphatase
MWRGGYFASPDAVEIIPGLHMGAAPSRRVARLMTRGGVSCAVDLRVDRAEGSPWPEAVRTFSYPLAEYGAPPVETLYAISKHVSALIQGGEIVYVHCRAGVQRAPMVACAVLMQMGWPLADSYRLVAARRLVAALTEGQLDTLKSLELDLMKHRVDAEGPAAIMTSKA